MNSFNTKKIAKKKQINKIKLNKIFYSIKKHFIIQKSTCIYKPIRYFGWSNKILKKNLYKQINQNNYVPKLYYSKLILFKFANIKNIRLSRIRLNNNNLNLGLKFGLKRINKIKLGIFKRKIIKHDKVLQSLCVRKTRYLDYTLKKLKSSLIRKSLSFLKSKNLRLNKFNRLKRIYYNSNYKLSLRNDRLGAPANQMRSYIVKIPKIQLLRELQSPYYKFYFRIHKLLNYFNYRKKRFFRINRKFEKNVPVRAPFKTRRYSLITKINSVVKKEKFINQFKRFLKKRELNKKKRFSSFKIKDIKLTSANFKKIKINRRWILTLNKTSLRQNKGGFKRILADVKKNKNRKRYFLFLNKKENNVFLTCTDYNGNVISSKSAGSCKIKTKKRKKSPDTIKAVSKAVVKDVKKRDIKFIYSLYTMNWYTKNIKLVLKEFNKQNLQILTIKALTNKPHSLVMKHKKMKRR
jgi:ribosomal protein S11